MSLVVDHLGGRVTDKDVIAELNAKIAEADKQIRWFRDHVDQKLQEAQRYRKQLEALRTMIDACLRSPE